MGRRNLIIIAVILISLLIGSPGLCDDDPPEADSESRARLFDGELSGEFGIRYRDEVNLGESDTIYQIQLNLDYHVELNDSWEWALGLRTGSTGRPSRGWVASGDFLDEDSFFLRPWTITHKGHAFGGELQMMAGAFEYPFDQSGMVFDGDFIRQGISQQLTLEPGNSGTNRFELGWSAQYLQDGDTHGDAWVVAGDASLRVAHGDSSNTTFQVSYIDYLNADTIGEAIVEDRLMVSGNAPKIGTNNYITGDGDLASDFNILLLRAEHEWDDNPDWPVELWGEYIINLGADEFEYVVNEGREDEHIVTEGAAGRGYAFGIDIGDRGNEGDIYFDISYVKLGNDAAMELYNRGKFGTNVRGWTTEARYYPRDDLYIRLEVFRLKNDSIREEIDPFNSRIFQMSIVAEF